MASNETSGPARGGSHYQPSLPVMFIILLLFVGATFVALRSHSHAAPAHHHTTSTTTTTTAPVTSSTVAKAKVTVQVANGTNITGLAETYTQTLQRLTWNTLPRINGPTETATVIYYHPGYLWAAQEIATEIGVPTSAATALAAGASVPGVAGATGDDVVVILGPDVHH